MSKKFKIISISLVLAVVTFSIIQSKIKKSQQESTQWYKGMLKKHAEVVGKGDVSKDEIDKFYFFKSEVNKRENKDLIEFLDQHPEFFKWDRIQDSNYYGCATFSQSLCTINPGFMMSQALGKKITYFHQSPTQTKLIEENLNMKMKLLKEYKLRAKNLIEAMILKSIERSFMMELKFTENFEFRKKLIQEFDRIHTKKLIPFLEYEFFSMTYSLDRTIEEQGFSQLFRSIEIGEEIAQRNQRKQGLFHNLQSWGEQKILQLLWDRNESKKKLYQYLQFLEKNEQALLEGKTLEESPPISEFKFYNFIYNPVGAILDSTGMPTFSRYITKWHNQNQEINKLKTKFLHLEDLKI